MPRIPAGLITLIAIATIAVPSIIIIRITAIIAPVAIVLSLTFIYIVPAVLIIITIIVFFSRAINKIVENLITIVVNLILR